MSKKAYQNVRFEQFQARQYQEYLFLPRSEIEKIQKNFKRNDPKILMYDTTGDFWVTVNRTSIEPLGLQGDSGGGGGPLPTTLTLYKRNIVINYTILPNTSISINAGLGNSLSLGTSSDFLSNNLIRILLNGVETEKGTECIYVSSSTIQFNRKLFSGENINIYSNLN